VSNKHGYCYFRIPKCANSTVAKTLAHYDPAIGVAEDDPDVEKTKKRFDGFLDVRALTPAALQKKYFLFTFVRNPYSRLLSAYLDKIAGRGDSSVDYNSVVKACGVERHTDVSFELFVGYLENRGLWANPHWAPQVAMIPVKPARLGFIGRVESLERDLATVIDRIFGAGTFVSTQTRADGRQHATSRIEQFYDDELARRVYGLYRQDFDTFAYRADWRVADAPRA
jgi:hypothetical protein